MFLGIFLRFEIAIAILSQKHPIPPATKKDHHILLGIMMLISILMIDTMTDTKIRMRKNRLY
jgi:hypothetical protein